MKVHNAVTALVVVFCCAGIASTGQSIQLEFRDGRVWLVASDAPVREILTEWARLGGATIVNGDAVEGTPITLDLDGVPEREALDLVLRDVAGYILTTRAAGSAGASVFARILIVPTSTSPPPPAPTVAARRPSSAPQRNQGLPEEVAALLGIADVAIADHNADDIAVEGDTKLPEPLAFLLGLDVTGAADAKSADGHGVERDAGLPGDLADILRSVTKDATSATELDSTSSRPDEAAVPIAR